MRYWRVLVKSGDGRQFFTRAVEITENRAVLRGDHALPAGMVCDLQIIIPSQDAIQPAGVAGLQAEVGAVVFASGDIRLDFMVRSLSNEARQLIASRKAGA